MTQEVKVIAGIVFATIAIIIGAVLFTSGPSTGALDASIDNQEILVRPDSNVTGNLKSKVTFVEFGDYQCPACAYAAPDIERIIQEYSGTVRFVFRNFPLSQHKHALIAAEAAEAAGAQGKYWEMYALLYRYQNEWSESSDPLPLFTNYAEELGLNTQRLTKEVQDKKYAEKIQRDANDGFAANVNSTPTFFINDVKMNVQPTYENVKELIETELRKISNE